MGLELVDHEAPGANVLERLTNEVIGCKPNGEWLEGTLRGADHKNWTADVFGQKQPPADPQDTPHLAYGLHVVWDSTQRESADHRIEGLGGKLEFLGIALPKIDVTPESGRPPSWR
jgi:hypothetical protein